MRFERLVIEAGENTFNLDFHSRLTVVSGVGRLEREGLISELVGSLSASRAGVHAEVVADNGNRFAIFRPYGARHRVVDIDAAVDVSSRFADSSGTIDLLTVAGLDPRTAKRRLRFDSSDLTTSTHHEQIVRRLGAIDPDHLWAIANKVMAAQNSLDAEAEDTGSVPEDAAVVARIEQRHDVFEQAQARAERFRKASFLVGALAALAAVPAAMSISQTAAMMAVIVAASVTAVSFAQNQRMVRARKAEEAALAEAGAKSYLGFHLQRVNGLLDSSMARERLIKANSNLEAAKALWHELAGAVSVEWALDYKDEIDTAARLRYDLSAFTHGPLSTDSEHDETADLAHALLARLHEVQSIGPGGESLPLVLDDPLCELASEHKAPLLEMLVRSSAHQQIVFMTEDQQVIDWARLEAMTGELTILEPTPSDERATQETGRRTAVA